MAKITKIGSRPDEWTPVVKIELSLREAMVLQAILGSTNGLEFGDLWSSLQSAFGEHGTGVRFDTIDLNSNAKLFDRFGAK